MDEKKDITTTNQNLNQMKKADLATVFQKDSDILFILKKAEKLSSALYIITSFFSETENLRSDLRKLAGKLITCSVGIKDTEINKNLAVDRIKNIVLEIVSKLEVASFAGFISEANSSIMKRELVTFTDLIIQKFSSKQYSRSISFDENFFFVPNDNREQNLSEGNITVPQKTAFKEDGRENVSVSDRLKSEPSDVHFHTQKRPNIQKDNFGDGKKDNRQKTILELIRNKREVTIKDVVNVVRGCSEKTIQRELLAMVKDGVLKKQGERRWSRYSLM